jgi:integrase
VVQYRCKGRSPRLKLGDVQVLTADEARKAGRKILARVALGEDPAADRVAQQQSNTRTLRAVIDDYLAEAESRLRYNSFRLLKLYLKGPAYFGPLHNIPIADIGVADVAARIGAIKRSSGATTAARARSALSAVFAWACGEGLMGTHPNNPVAFSNKPAAAAPRDRVLSDHELANVWHACGDDDGGKVVRLLMIVPARRHELAGMTFAELDLERGTW